MDFQGQKSSIFDLLVQNLDFAQLGPKIFDFWNQSQFQPYRAGIETGSQNDWV